jgi:hypothetical protein
VTSLQAGLTLHRVEGRPARRGRVLLHAWKVVPPYDEVRPSSRGGSSGITTLATCETSTSALPRLAVCLSMLVMVTLQMMMPTGHPLEPRSSKHGRTCQWMMGRPPRMEGHPSTLVRSLVETIKHHPSMLGRSGRPTSRIGPDRFSDRHGYSRSPNLVASLAPSIACRVGIEVALLGQRRLACTTTKPRCPPTKAGGPPGKARRAADRRRDLRSSMPRK